MINEYGWLIALGGIIAAGWNQIQRLSLYIRYFFIEECEFDGPVAMALTSIIQNEGKLSKFFKFLYSSEFLFDTKNRRRIHRPITELSSSRGLVKFRGKYIWIDCNKGSDPGDRSTGDFMDESASSSKYHTGTAYITLYALRGSFDFKSLIAEASEKLNNAMKGTKKGRFQINIITGDAGNGGNSKLQPKVDETRSAIEKLPFEALNYSGIKPINWKFDDLFLPDNNHEYIAPDSLKRVTNIIEEWYKSEQWFIDRSIPWKMGFLLHGAPGTGKSSYVTHIARTIDIPLYVFDLSTLRNDELVKQWRKVASCSPAVILIEDIGALYDGTNRTSENADYASFDCLLNCIDGAEKHHGILLFMTTNHIDRIEPALIRNGRVDNIVELFDMCDVDRKKLINRILHDIVHEDELEIILDETCGMTPSDVQSYCTAYALNIKNKLLT